MRARPRKSLGDTDTAFSLHRIRNSAAAASFLQAVWRLAVSKPPNIQARRSASSPMTARTSSRADGF